MSDVDLTNCDREPIHLLGEIQPFGFLLAVTGQWMVAHASDNTQAFLGEAAEALIGRSLTDVLDGHAVHEIRGRLQIMRGADSVERVFNLPLRAGGEPFEPFRLKLENRWPIIAVAVSVASFTLRCRCSAAQSRMRAMSSGRSSMGMGAAAWCGKGNSCCSKN